MAGLIPGKLTHVDDGFEYVIRELNKVRCDSIGDQLNLLRKQIKLMWGMVTHLRWVELRQRRRAEQAEALLRDVLTTIGHMVSESTYGEGVLCCDGSAGGEGYIHAADCIVPRIEKHLDMQ